MDPVSWNFAMFDDGHLVDWRAGYMTDNDIASFVLEAGGESMSSPAR
jgi:hypothetical protein